MTKQLTERLDIAVLSDEPLIEIGADRYTKLRRFNLIMGGIHLVSGAIMLALSNDFSIPVVSSFRQTQPGPGFDVDRTDTLFNFSIAAGTVAFLFLSAFFHFVVSTVGYSRYKKDLARGMNRFRWVEYALSATLMIILIALLPGVQDIAALVAIAGANIAMILFGWVMEAVNRPGRKTYWTPFIFGSIIGLVPWIAMGFYLFGSEGVPSFVFIIYATIFVFFNSFGINQWLQYARIGKWEDYLFGESVYIVLSLAAKSALAWQIFANTLV